jgi:Nucleotidyltransferase of unknown function (DUF6036)
MPPDIPKPWGAFLKDLDRKLKSPVELHCLGGLVMTMRYGLRRPTADIGVLAVRPRVDLSQLAGIGSSLHKRHCVYLQVVTVLDAYPEDYGERLTEMFPGSFKNLRLLALDPYDLALTKLGRNSQRDREDVFHLADAVPLDIGTLRARYREMRPCLGNPEREDLTLKLWIQAIEEQRKGK